QKELAAFMDREKAQAELHSSIHTFTTMCWDKCITGTPSTRFSRGEESCLLNCVDRFFDTSMFLVKKVCAAYFLWLVIPLIIHRYRKNETHKLYTIQT
ncbi:Tim10/DDP family zinc finger-domain-containing protein, partial [Mycena floridula]